MEYIDNDLLIFEVSKHEELYNTESEYYRDKVLKQDAWMQVCQVLVENETSPEGWEKMDREERARICRQVQKRWKSLRDCFVRSVLKAQNQKGKSKEYYYSKQMSFLLPFTKCIQTSESTSDNEEKEQTLQPSTSTDSNSSREDINVPFDERINEAADVLEIELVEEPECQNLATYETQTHLGNGNVCVEYQKTGQPNFSSEVKCLPSSKHQKVSEDLSERKSLNVYETQKQANQQFAQPNFSKEREVTCLPSSKRQKVSEDLSERKSLNIYASQKQANHAVQPYLQGARSVEVHGNNSSSSSQSEYESDKLFLMSLLPNITKLNELDKLDFKSEVIQLLKCFSRSSS